MNREKGYKIKLKLEFYSYNETLWYFCEAYSNFLLSNAFAIQTAAFSSIGQEINPVTPILEHFLQ